MFKFKTPQKVFDIGRVKIGGQPGENPTVLVGSIFYHGHKILLDEKTGKVDKEGTEDLIKLQEEFSDRTGNPCMLDVVGATGKSMKKLIGFVTDLTETPVMIDSPSTEVKVAGIRYAGEVGLEKRVIYNSLIPESKPEEFEAIIESGIESSVILAFKRRLRTGEDRVNAIKELLLNVERAGVLKPIVDMCVVDIPSLSMACRAIIDLKKELGLPCGCGAHNAISTWAGFKERMGAQAMQTTTVTVNTVPVVLGADFILYGPIEDCQYVFPSVAAIDISYSYLNKIKEQLTL